MSTSFKMIRLIRFLEAPSFDAGHFKVVAPRGSTDLDPMAGLVLQMMSQAIQEMEDSGDFAF